MTKRNSNGLSVVLTTHGCQCKIKQKENRQKNVFYSLRIVHRTTASDGNTLYRTNSTACRRRHTHTNATYTANASTVCIVNVINRIALRLIRIHGRLVIWTVRVRWRRVTVASRHLRVWVARVAVTLRCRRRLVGRCFACANVVGVRLMLIATAAGWRVHRLVAVMISLGELIQSFSKQSKKECEKNHYTRFVH